MTCITPFYSIFTAAGWVGGKRMMHAGKSRDKFERARSLIQNVNEYRPQLHIDTHIPDFVNRNTYFVTTQQNLGACACVCVCLFEFQSECQRNRIDSIPKTPIDHRARGVDGKSATGAIATILCPVRRTVHDIHQNISHSSSGEFMGGAMTSMKDAFIASSDLH